LLSYDAQDEEPSIFFLREDGRQSILVVFNWTEQPRSHTVKLSDLGLSSSGAFHGADVLNHAEAVPVNAGAVQLDVPPHAVRVVKLIDPAAAAAAPTMTAQVPSAAKVSESITLAAEAQETGVPALSYHWDFGDGTTTDGPRVTHAYTRDGDFAVRLTADGLDGLPARQSFTVKVTGTLTMPTEVQSNRRY
jgi:hypothetical protein